MDRFEEAVRAAIDSIPTPFQPYLENTQFLIEESSPEGLLGLYEGATALDAGQWLPEESCETWDELVEEVQRTILHEVGHHFGMDEDELPY
jgi:predicted Zn-dependent protease with MMP-like domain